MATRRSRIQIKPNTGRVGGGGPAKPALAKASPRKPSVSKPPNVEVSPAESVVSVTEKTPQPPPAEEIANSVTSPVVQTAIASPVRQEVTPVVSEKDVVDEHPVEEVEIVTETVIEQQTKDSETVKPKKRPRVVKPQPNVKEASGRGSKRRPSEPVVEVEDDDKQTEERTESPVIDVEDAPPPDCPSLPPSRPSGKAVLEKRARKENRELHARKRRQYRPGSKSTPPDRSSMTMLDLIYYNPPGNPMPEKTTKTAIVEEVTAAAEASIEEEEEENAEEESVGPRVRVGPDGEITIDEESLVIRRGPAKEDSRAVVYETGTETHYGSFRKKTSGKRTWTTRETARFYRALSVCGTDFTLMSTFFPKRTRQDLKNKFKREERTNRELVDKTINDPTQFDTLGLEDEEEEVEEERVDNPDDPREAQNGHNSLVPRKRRKGRQSKKPDDPPAEVEMEVVEVDTAADNVVHLDEEEREPTPPPAPQACATPLVGTPPPGGVLSQGQLVFYASHSQEQVVHVFVVSPQANVSASELVSRLSTPPLSQQKGTPGHQVTPQRTPRGGLTSPLAQASTGAYADVPTHSVLHRTPGIGFLPKGITPLNASPSEASAVVYPKGIVPLSSAQPLSSQESGCEHQSTSREKSAQVSAPHPLSTVHAAATNLTQPSSLVVTAKAVCVCETSEEDTEEPLPTPPNVASVVAPALTEKSEGQSTISRANSSSAGTSEQSARQESGHAGISGNSSNVESAVHLPAPRGDKFVVASTPEEPQKEKSASTPQQRRSGPASAHEQSQKEKSTPSSSPLTMKSVSVINSQATPLCLSPSSPLRENSMSATNSRTMPLSLSLSTPSRNCETQNTDRATPLSRGVDVPEKLGERTKPHLTPPKGNCSPASADLMPLKENPVVNSEPLTDDSVNVQCPVPGGVPKQTSVPPKSHAPLTRRRRAVVCPKTTSEPRARPRAGAT